MGMILCCTAFIIIGLGWLLLFSVKTEPKAGVKLDHTRMSLLNGTGVDPAGQLFKQCIEGSTNCISDSEITDFSNHEMGQGNGTQRRK